MPLEGDDQWCYASIRLCGLRRVGKEFSLVFLARVDPHTKIELYRYINLPMHAL